MNTSNISSTFLVDLWNGKDVNAIKNIFSDTTLVSSPIKKETGSRGLIDIMETWFEAFPKAYIKVENSISENNQCALHWTCYAKHEGYFLGRAPTGINIQYTGSTFLEFDRNKKISYYSANVNILDILKNFGILNPDYSKNQQPSNFLPDSLQIILGISLTKREVECLSLSICGMSAKYSSKILQISHRTIEKHLDNVRFKMGLNIQADVKENLYYKDVAYLFQLYGNSLIKDQLNQHRTL